ncbi:peroxiredoxin-like family protein [Gallaecimonas xiamenensis]|uniref:thioredoxin-dependent peroxiredoxin n=1 Tax=Gallaecimonas xiamenensis 3-C-1 TaxID=745411 RepID=K2JTR8_9GAMM|nr:peroxiredoxin-like family protein [Gallaecimonas xiamenensis]EKE77917.1 putative peroxiredoxin family protein [Gallaecimonas xiamenensis 3-C-1]
MSLLSAIQGYQQQFRERVPAETQETMKAATEALRQSGIEEAAVKVGDSLPDATFSNQLGQPVNLSALWQQGPLVLSFYRGGWCPYCNLELKALEAILPELKAAGASLVAITPELPDQSLSTAEKNALSFQVLSDPGADFAKALGLVFSLPEVLRPIYSGFGIDLEKHNGQGHFELPLAATLVVDTKGQVTWAFVDADYTKRAEPAAVLAALQG